MASSGAKLDGLDNAMRNLNREISGVRNRTAGGLLRAGGIILAEAKDRVPVEYGDLRDSGYVLLETEELAVDIGFTAPYALFVHENLEQKLKGKPRPSGIGVYWGPHGQPKFLESAIIDKTEEAVDAVVESARIKSK